MIRLSQVSLRRGAKLLLEQTDLALNPGEHAGLIGANGSGKSSLFALLRDELHADKGDVDLPKHWRIAHVAQETPALERPAVDYAIDGDTRLRGLEEKLSSAESANDGSLMAELHASLADADVYTARPRAEALLLGLGFKIEELEKPVSSFSGGWRMRLNLAQALMTPSDLLLLDEPTNHLDLDAIIWLEEWLRRYPGTLLVISHDRDFLDGVVKSIVHIDQKKLQALYRRLLELRSSSARRQVVLTQNLNRKTGARACASAVVHRPLPRQGDQGAPGAEPHEDAGEDGGPGAAARRRAVRLRVPRSRALARSASGTGGRHRRVRRKGRAAGREALAALRRAHWPARRERRGQVDPRQDHCRCPADPGGKRDLQQGSRDRLLRAAPGRDAARRRVAAVAS